MDKSNYRMGDWVLQPIRQLHRDGSTTVQLKWRWDGKPPPTRCTAPTCRLCAKE